MLRSEEEESSEGEQSEEYDEPAKKKAKTSAKKPTPAKTTPGKKASKIKSSGKIQSSKYVESSDDDMPLRPTVSDADVKSAIRIFLAGKDLTTVTKGMVKEALRKKFGDELVSSKRQVISEGIKEGMES